MSSASALKVNWTFGFSKNVTGGVHSLTTPNRNAIFYISSHSADLHFENRTQMILQGHCNPISCCVVSEDKRWIVRGILVTIPFLWCGILTLVHLLRPSSPHAYGIRGLDITSDSLYVATLGARSGTSCLRCLLAFKEVINANLFSLSLHSYSFIISQGALKRWPSGTGPTRLRTPL